MLIVQVAPGASVAPQVVPVKLYNVFEIPATDSAVIVTGVVPAAPLFVIVTTAVTGARGARINPKLRVRVPATVPSVACGHDDGVPQLKVAEVKARGPTDAPLPERLTGEPVPVAGPLIEV